MTCLREGVVDLPDGRRLGYGEYGVRGGTPVLVFHGGTGGRQFDPGPPARECGVWAFTLERPGFGLSDRLPGRKLTDWPRDVAAFADAFGLDRFAVAGFSAGGPYALASGHDLPDRVAVVGLICGFVAFPEDPALDEIYTSDQRDLISQFRSDPEAGLAALERDAADEVDRWAADPDGFFREIFGPMADSMPPFWKALTGSTFGARPGAQPDDLAVLGQPMGFDVTKIRVPIRGWYGDQDGLLAGARELNRRVPSMELAVLPGQGHFIDDRYHRDWWSVLADW